MPSRAYVVSFTTVLRERKRTLEWLRDEWKLYADLKFDRSTEAPKDVYMREEGVGPDSWWERQTTMYIRRAHVLGLETKAGRQALMKGFTTYGGMLESMVRVYGDPPPAGTASGDVGDD